MGLDYIFIKQLLLAKKKYAALKITDQQIVKLEVRGLDMVRRDWCELSREVSKKAIELLMWENKSNGIEKVNRFVSMIGQMLANKSSKVMYKYFMMTKSVSKSLKCYKEDYPHLHVARELEKRGKQIKSGFVVEYLILGQEFARKYFKIPDDRIEELSQSERSIPYSDYTKFKNLHPVDTLDIQWYITSQLLPPLERLCNPIPELSRAQLSQCFGITVTESDLQYTTNNADEVAIASDIR